MVPGPVADDEPGEGIRAVPRSGPRGDPHHRGHRQRRRTALAGLGRGVRRPLHPPELQRGFRAVVERRLGERPARPVAQPAREPDCDLLHRAGRSDRPDRARRDEHRSTRAGRLLLRGPRPARSPRLAAHYQEDAQGDAAGDRRQCRRRHRHRGDDRRRRHRPARSGFPVPRADPDRAGQYRFDLR